MNVILYRLRDAGRPLSYAEVMARPRPRGRLVMGTWGNPEVHAMLFGEWPDVDAPRIDHARVAIHAAYAEWLTGKGGYWARRWDEVSRLAVAEVFGENPPPKLQVSMRFTYSSW